MSVAEWLCGFSVTDTLTVALAWAGVTACSCVELMYSTEEAETPPNATDADCVNPVPDMVTVVPPAVGPEFGPAPLIASWVPDWPQCFPLEPPARLATEQARIEIRTSG